MEIYVISVSIGTGLRGLDEPEMSHALSLSISRWTESSSVTTGIEIISVHKWDQNWNSSLFPEEKAGASVCQEPVSPTLRVMIDTSTWSNALLHSINNCKDTESGSWKLFTVGKTTYGCTLTLHPIRRKGSITQKKLDSAIL